MVHKSWKLYSVILTLAGFYVALIKGEKESDKEAASLQLPPCQACTMVYKSFLEAMEQTAQTHFGGGDTSWEEAKLGSYATSEVRLIEIQELLCRNKRAQSQCLTLVEQWEQYIEDWWFKQRDTYPDLYNYLCVETLKVCCPKGHYGSECKPCLGYPDNICNSNGLCEGSGTKSGSGMCICEESYTGDLCEKCAPNYFEVYKDKKLLCAKCDESCDGCTSSGPQNCNSCANGWIMDAGHGCLDVDECKDSNTYTCTKQEFCSNFPGSYECVSCHVACNGCFGDGPVYCITCADGYVIDEDTCVKKPEFNTYSFVTERLTYIGMGVGTYVLLKHQPIWAFSIMSTFAIYVAFGDYILENLQNVLHQIK